MSDTNNKAFPSYLEIPAQLTPGFWWSMRSLSLLAFLLVMWLVASNPAAGFSLFWKVLIPTLPLVFAVAPGFWRQICPMALVNQLPRTFGFSKDLTLPVRVEKLAYVVSMLAFFILVSFHHVYFNRDPSALLILVFGALALAFIGGVFFKGRSGWCGTFCPVAPIQKAYGHAPIIAVRNGYCPTCVGCQKNCYDFNPRAAFLSDLADTDRWYSGHKKFFVAGLPGFAIGIFTAGNLAESSLAAYYLYLAGCILATVIVYAVVRLLTGLTDFRAAALAAMSALMIFYWYTGPDIVSTIASMAGVQSGYWPTWLPFFVASLVSMRVLYLGRIAEKDFRVLNNTEFIPRVSIKIHAIPTPSSHAVDVVVCERNSGRSLAAGPSRTLLDGIESAGLTKEFGCRMGMCGADPVAIVEGMDALSPPCDEELATLRRLGLEGRARMACVSKATGAGVTIDLGIDPYDLPEPPSHKNQRDLGAELGIHRVVIIGNGTAGMVAADEVRRLSASCKIDVIAKEKRHFYNRMAIGRMLYGRTALERLYLTKPDWPGKRKIDVRLNTQVIGINRNKKLVSLATGESLPYDKLVLAMGSSGMMPPAEGNRLNGCFVLREASDAQAVRTWRQEQACETAVVLGGGVLGIEAVDALRRLNLKTTIVQMADRLMDKELDEKGSTILRKFLEGLGIRVITGATVVKVLGGQSVEKLELSNGDIIDADIYVACAGVKANIDVAEAAGLAVRHGVIVDAAMRTSDPDIFAAGDVAELPGSVSGLWPIGTAQAAVAAASLFGKEARYVAPSTVVSLKMSGIDVKGFGNLEGGDGIEEIVDPEEPENEHRRLFIKNGQIVGAVFVGPPGTGQDIGQAIEKKASLHGIIERLRNKDWSGLARL